MTDAAPLALGPDDDDAKLLAVVVGYYHETLKNTPDALGYLRHRGITNPVVIDHFRVGYSDRSLGLKLPPKQVQAGAAIRSRFQALGLFRASGHEHLRGSLTFPVTAADGSGRIVDIYGRKTGEPYLRKGTPLHVHLNDRREGVWNVEAFGAAEEVILTGSMFDALSFWSAGYRNVTTSFGAVTDDLLAAFEEFSVRRVLTTSEAVVEKLLAAGLETFLVRLPPGSDVNDYMRRTADPADALGALLRHAEWCGRGSPPPVPVLVPAVRPDAVGDVVGDLLGVDEGCDDIDGVPGEGGPEDPQEDDEGPAGPPVVHPDVPPTRTASPLPPVPPADDVVVSEGEVVFHLGSRRYRVRGLDRNAALDQMRVNVLAGNGVGLHIDTLDLYAAKPRAGFVAQAAAEMNLEERVVKADLGRVLLKLEELQDGRLHAARPKADAPFEMTADDRRDALALLTAPDLLDRIVADFRIVGDRSTLLVAYLGAVSRKLDGPLSVLVQSASAAGKTTLVDAVLALVPPEDVVKFSAMTGQSLYYMTADALKNKILAVAEEAGAQKASYAMKLLASEGELRIASTGKEADTGRLVAQEYTVTGPTAIFTSTTSTAVDEELLNRCVVLAVDESAEQTRHIHRRQRERRTLAGLVAARSHERVRHLHHNAQRLLRPVPVVNPWATGLTFPSHQTRTRRDHQKYLTLIECVTFLHQHQRPRRSAEIDGRPVEYIETTLEDIAVANDLAAAVLGRSLDELPPQTRNLLTLLDGMVAAAAEREGIERSDVRLTARQAREFTGWGQSQLKLHVKRLVDFEFLLAHRDRAAKRFVYEMAYTPTADGRALPGLIDVGDLRRAEWAGYDGQRPGLATHRPGSGRGSAGPKPGHGRGAETEEIPVETGPNRPNPAARGESTNHPAP